MVSLQPPTLAQLLSFELNLPETSSSSPGALVRTLTAVLTRLEESNLTAFENLRIFLEVNHMMDSPEPLFENVFSLTNDGFKPTLEEAQQTAQSVLDSQDLEPLVTLLESSMTPH